VPKPQNKHTTLGFQLKQDVDMSMVRGVTFNTISRRQGWINLDTNWAQNMCEKIFGAKSCLLFSINKYTFYKENLITLEKPFRYF